MITTEEFRKVNNFYGNLPEYVLHFENRPNLINESGFCELSKHYAMMKDGLLLEFCFWHEYDYYSEINIDMYVEDISVDREKFDEAYDISFEEYLNNMGIYTENIETAQGMKWRYMGQMHFDDYNYRAQYLLEGE